MTLTLLPESISVFSATVLVIASFFTSALTASAGIGGGLLMLALMTYLVPIQAIIPVHGLVQFGSNAGRSWVQRAHINWPIAWVFLFGSIVGAAIGAMVAVQLSKNVLELFLGLFILVLVWMRFPPIRNANRFVVWIGGCLTTFTSMFAGATGPLVAVFLNKLFTEHRALVATHGITMTAQHGVKILAFGAVGFAFSTWVPLVAMMIASGYLGTLAGTRLMNALPEEKLKLAFKLTLTLTALDLVRRGIDAF